MNMKLYMLDADNHAIEIKDSLTWGRWLQDANRTVGMTQITSAITVSTVFLGLDHRFFGKGPPILFETMIFGGPLDQETWRYSSWDDAEIGHRMMVAKARAAISQRVEP